MQVRGLTLATLLGYDYLAILGILKTRCLRLGQTGPRFYAHQPVSVRTAACTVRRISYETPEVAGHYKSICWRESPPEA